jgi:hypothetical protein
MPLAKAEAIMHTGEREVARIRSMTRARCTGEIAAYAGIGPIHVTPSPNENFRLTLEAGAEAFIEEGEMNALAGVPDHVPLVSNLEKRLAAVESERDALAEELDGCKDEIVSLKQALRRYKRLNDELALINGGLHGEIATLTQRCAALQLRLQPVSFRY